MTFGLSWPIGGASLTNKAANTLMCHGQFEGPLVTFGLSWSIGGASLTSKVGCVLSTEFVIT